MGEYLFAFIRLGYSPLMWRGMTKSFALIGEGDL